MAVFDYYVAEWDWRLERAKGREAARSAAAYAATVRVRAASVERSTGELPRGKGRKRRPGWVRCC
ncbi:hypothetical protein N5079_30170 [Planotetraspora sp. A-T 1434]|uniref:hypothetical protein n=1 Tax=Planotetraspora sp. A-T 1434 TaxID=2979219 RepID=UPI0021C0A3C7|nr:hypothetical protein [Planotetraspora sp. A-T 1434]MCT9934480.1 hypothetical protein [Planotetraspora sp. A-T 1434]